MHPSGGRLGIGMAIRTSTGAGCWPTDVRARCGQRAMTGQQRSAQPASWRPGPRGSDVSKDNINHAGSPGA